MAENEERTINDDGSVTYSLALPVASEGEDITTVTLRRCKPSDLLAADGVRGGAEARNVFLVARLGNIPEATVKKLDGYDYMQLNDIASGFLTRRPGTGAKPS